MFRGLLLIFSVAFLSTLYPIRLDWLLGAEAQEDAVLDFLKEIEMQKIKAKILKELGMTDASLRSGSSSSSSRPKLSPDVIKMLVSENEDRLSIKQKHDAPKLMVFPENDDFTCEWSEEPSCRRFEYNLPPKAEISSSEFWLRKLQSSPGDNLTISVSCSDSEKILMKKTDQVFLDQEEEEKWDIYRLSALEKLTSRKREVECQIETSGITMDNSSQNLPFLKMNEARATQLRRRRSENVTGRHKTCKTIPFNFSFEVMGYGDYIVHPLSFVANICEGYCLHSENQYENLMDMYFNHDPELERRYSRCWATCCRPVEYQDMMLMYKDQNGTHHIRNITRAIAARCDCS